MRLVVRLAYLAIGCSLPAACFVYDEELLLDGAPACETAEDCPGASDACLVPSCDAGTCASTFAAAGTACGGGAAACDGEGRCVGCAGPDDCESGFCDNSVSPAICTSCTSNDDCQPAERCDDGRCVPAASEPCGDGEKNGDETDVDCGGETCEPCADGKECALASDCASGICDGTCTPPSCSDGVLNGSETGLDCGGGCPETCADGVGCEGGGDCDSGVCAGGVCQKPACGDGVVNGDDECDDGNLEPFDGCSRTCRHPADHLLLSEMSVGPTDAEFVEIYNPTKSTIALGDVYLADFAGYHQITSGNATHDSYDFLVRFPDEAKIGPGKLVVVSLESASAFEAVFGSLPDFDLAAEDAKAPAMVGTYGGNSGLTNNGEMLILFTWDGESNTVADLDYLVFGSSADKVDKSAVPGYAADTPVSAQASAPAPDTAMSLHRCDTSEDSEKTSGGNGLTGHDETSEDFKSAWRVLTTPTPGAPPPPEFCN